MEGGEGRGEEEPRHVWNELLPLPLSSSLTRTKGCARTSSIFLASFFFAPSSVSPLGLLLGSGESMCAKNKAKLTRLLSASSCYPFGFNFSQVHMPPCTFVGASVLTTSLPERTDELYLVTF